MVGDLIGVEKNCQRIHKLMEDAVFVLIICLGEDANSCGDDSDYEDRTLNAAMMPLLLTVILMMMKTKVLFFKLIGKYEKEEKENVLSTEELFLLGYNVM